MLTKLFAAAVLAAGASAQLAIATPPSLSQCIPVLLTWTGGQGPYYLDVIPGQQTTAQPLENLLTNSDSTSYTWRPDLEPGTSINFKITDSTGAYAFTSELAIGTGNSGCMNGTAGGGEETVVSSTDQTLTITNTQTTLITTSTAITTGTDTETTTETHTGITTSLTTGTITQVTTSTETGTTTHTTTGTSVHASIVAETGAAKPVKAGLGAIAGAAIAAVLL